MTPQNTPLYAQDLGAWAKTSTKPTYTATEVGAISTSAKGANNGVAELDANGKVPSSQLPSYVDDVLEYNSSSNFPATGETGKIYIDISDNTTYRWSGSTYVAIGSSLALGTTSSTAFRGDYGNTAYQHASAKGSEFSSGLYKIATNAEGHVTAATAVAKADITALGIPAQDTTYTFDGTYNASTNKAATVQTVTNAIGALDGGTIGTGGTGKTITSLTQTDGNVSATFADISITKSQVSDLGTIGAAAEKGVDTSITAGSTSTNLPTSGAVASFMAGQQKRGNAKIFVGTCDTAASTAAKVVTCSDYDQLVVGDKIYVTFTQGNTVYGSSYDLTLNVNNKGAKTVRLKTQNGTDYLRVAEGLNKGGEYLFTYDGTYWLLIASTVVYTRNLDQYDSESRPLIVGDYRKGNFGSSPQILSNTYDLYYRYGKLYANNSELLTEHSDALIACTKRIDASDIMHDQYLDNLQSSNHYRAVLRIFFVTPNGHIFAKDQESRSEFFDYHDYYISIKAYDSSNNVVETYYDDGMMWNPWNWDTSWDDAESIMTEYWMEFPFEFDASDTDIDHISVSFSGLDNYLSMYNPNQNLNFNCHPTNHETVEIKNVGLIYGWWDEYYKGGFRETGFTLPEETVNVPQRWAEELNEAHRVRGYSFEIYRKDGDINQWYTVEGNDSLPAIWNAIVGYNNNLYYTNGYFLIPITEGSGDSVQSNQGVTNAGKILAVNSSGVVEPVSMNAVESNQGVANAGKFLVVNSSGTVEPVSMTAWQGGSY